MKKPTLFVSLIPVILLVVIIFTCVRLFGDEVTAGPSQFTLLLVTIIASAIARLKYRLTWEKAEEAMFPF